MKSSRNGPKRVVEKSTYEIENSWKTLNDNNTKQPSEREKKVNKKPTRSKNELQIKSWTKYIRVCVCMCKKNSLTHRHTHIRTYSHTANKLEEAVEWVEGEEEEAEEHSRKLKEHAWKLKQNNKSRTNNNDPLHIVFIARKRLKSDWRVKEGI